MKQNEQQFLKTLQSRARDQAILEESSPLPLWTRPLAARIGMHYWVFLLLLSFLLSVAMSVWFFPGVYHAEVGGF